MSSLRLTPTYSTTIKKSAGELSKNKKKLDYSSVLCLKYDRQKQFGGWMQILKLKENRTIAICPRFKYITYLGCLKISQNFHFLQSSKRKERVGFFTKKKEKKEKKKRIYKLER